MVGTLQPDAAAGAAAACSGCIKDTVLLLGTVPADNAVLLRFAPAYCRAGCGLSGWVAAPSPNFSPMTQDQIKDLKGRAEALRRYL